ncbi:MAG TPA: GNAT family N-acetyltransferase [Vicinamibacterales bacterium]|nr:GNAT family N-acetyltransferase [Vicinamibacterales bacterium]
MGAPVQRPREADFEKKLIVRPLRMDDYERVTQLQQRSFPQMRPWTREQFASHVRAFPEGQIGIEYGGVLVASSSSLLLDFGMYDGLHTWAQITDHGTISTHNPRGTTLYGIEIMVDPDYRGMKLARRLYDARKQLARDHNLMSIVLGGRIPGYHQYASKMSAREYVDKVMDKSLVDPVLTPQLANGFVLKRLLQNYLPADEDSRGWATFLEWSNLDYQPDPNRRLIAARRVRICAVQYQMRRVADFEEFAKQCEYFVDVASDYKCDFILFPELFTTQLLSFLKAERPGLAVRRLAEYTPRYLELFSALALRHDINIVGGSIFVVEDERLFNVAYLFHRNGGVDKQYKLHVTPNERRWWGVEPGRELKIFETDKGKVSIQICYDVEFPELGRLAAEQGAEIFFVPFCTDERYGYLRVRYCAQARCIENHVYVAMAGTVGNLPDVTNMDVQYAQSGILTPADIPFSRDAIAAECTPNIETVIIDDVDLELLSRHRQTGNVLNWKDRRADLYEVRLRASPDTTRP